MRGERLAGAGLGGPLDRRERPVVVHGGVEAGVRGRPSVIACAISRYTAAICAAGPAGTPAAMSRKLPGTGSSAAAPWVLLSRMRHSPQPG